MKRHRSRLSLIFLTFSLALVVALAVAPAGAMAGSLLSGYGGPGAGTQALLGSTLANGASPPGGSGTGSTGGGSGTARGGAGSSSSAGATGTGDATGTGSGTQAGGSGAARGGVGRSGARDSGQQSGSQSAKSAFGASAGGSAAYTSRGPLRSATGLVAAEDGGALGITGLDILLLLLVLGVLVLTAGMTRRLAGTPH